MNLAPVRNRILGLLAAGATLAGVAAVSSAAPAHAWSGCEGDCVGPVKIVQVLTDKSEAFLTFTTNVPANVKISAKPVGGAVVATRSEPAGLRTSHSISTGPKLDQGKGFVISITATDSRGKSYTEQLSLTSLSRTVTLTLKTIKVTEDSDVGAGELAAGLRIGNSVFTIFGRRSVTAPTTLTLNKAFTAKAVPIGGRLAVEINDDDADPGEFCTNGTGFSFTSGSNSCMDWTYGQTTISGPSLPGTQTNTFSFSANGALKFTVTGSYVVTVK